MYTRALSLSLTLIVCLPLALSLSLARCLRLSTGKQHRHGFFFLLRLSVFMEEVRSGTYSMRVHKANSITTMCMLSSTYFDLMADGAQKEDM